MRWLLVVLAVCTLSACAANTVSGLSYTAAPVATAQAGPGTVAGVDSTDQRKEDPNRLATVMGGFGNPLKTLDTPKPVKDVVADAFVSGLQSRGLMGSGGKAPLRIALVVHKFDADMMVGRTARIDVSMSVVDHAGRTIYEDRATDSESETKAFQTGIFADINDLKKLCEIVLARTVNHMLDKPEFLAAVKAAA